MLKFQTGSDDLSEIKRTPIEDHLLMADPITSHTSLHIKNARQRILYCNTRLQGFLIGH